MATPLFLDLEHIMRLHRSLIERYGGTDGTRDIGMLHSAISMPQASYGGEYLHADLYEMAAAYMYHIVQNHPFIDGNKRTAFAVTDVFLKMNGILISASPEDTVSFVYSLYGSKTFNFEELATWLRNNTE